MPRDDAEGKKGGESSPESPTPGLLALDFDGVICDSVYEGFLSAWKVYGQLWPPPSPPPPGLAETFRRLRPVIETGWEFVILLRLLQEGVPEEEITARFQEEWCPRILERYGLDAADIGKRLDRVRDERITTDLGGWLANQRFYPGVADRLCQLLQQGFPLFILTTKEARFARKLLEQHGVPFPPSQVLGKEQEQPKTVLLRHLGERYRLSGREIWFVEDRLKTLQRVLEAGKEGLYGDMSIRLFLADWGYNTPADREAARQNPEIQVLSLSQFGQDFSAWRVERCKPRSKNSRN
ncbi:MAG: HAD family hydrolase [Nitrospinota bacterium]|nr:MAG: HAD family hydrolase [Nitrospinota bacterium]